MTAIRDAEEWIARLKRSGIKRFKFKELPDELKNMHFFRKAIELNKIGVVEKDSNNVATWQVM